MSKGVARNRARQGLLELKGGARLIAASTLLFVTVVMTFLAAVHNSYVNYDDPAYLMENTQVQAGLSWANVKWAFTTDAIANWHPLTWLSHMLDCQMFGPKLWGHHLTSVLVHGANAVLLFLLLRACTGSFWRSLLVAACFGLHPLRVESVAWLSERKDVLSGGFGLAALIAYVAYCKTATAKEPAAAPKVQPCGLQGVWSPLRNSRYWLALLLFTMSLLSKPMMVTLPCAMLLLDYWPLKRHSQRSWWQLAEEKTPFFALSAIDSLVTIAVQKSGGAMEQMGHMSLMVRLENALVSYTRYLGKFFWPENLSPIYPVTTAWPAYVVAGAAVLIIGASIAFFLIRNRAAYALIGWLWFLGTLVPVIGLVAVGEQSMADRYTYFPLIGITVILAWGIHDVLKRWPGCELLAGAAWIALLIACAGVSHQQVKVWSNSETLFRHALSVTKDNYSAHANLAAALQDQGRLDEALLHHSAAARLRPDAPETHNNLGAVLGRMGRVEAAIGEFREALRLSPRNAQAHHNLATALVQQGNLAEAIEHYSEAATTNPGAPLLMNDWGVALAMAGRFDEAISRFHEAVRLEPRFASAHENLAKALSQQGRSAEAEIHYQKAARLNARAGR